MGWWQPSPNNGGTTMSLWLTNLPSWASFILVVGVTTVLALAATLAARSWHGRRGVTSGPVVVTAWATCIGALVAVLCAFTIITLWSIFTRAQTDTNGEVAAIRLAARDLSPSQLPLLRAYVSASAAEWPRMCGGVPDERVARMLTTLQRAARPRGPQYESDLYGQLTTLEDMRDERWHSAYAGAPIELKTALIIIALTLFGVLALALPDRRDAHLALTVLIGIAIGSVFWVMVALAYPYCGSVSIGPDQVATALQSL
jgi:hypothetical protein